jgi:hypothetical protein
LRFLVIVILSIVWGSLCASHMGVGPNAMLAGIIGGGLIGGAVACTRKGKV